MSETCTGASMYSGCRSNCDTAEKTTMQRQRLSPAPDCLLLLLPAGHFDAADTSTDWSAALELPCVLLAVWLAASNRHGRHVSCTRRYYALGSARFLNSHRMEPVYTYANHGKTLRGLAGKCKILSAISWELSVKSTRQCLMAFDVLKCFSGRGIILVET